MGSNSGKHFKGQDQVIQGSPTGEALVINRFDYGAPCGDLKYLGEAKTGSEEIDCKWFIEFYEYGAPCQITAIKSALNLLTTGATAVTVDSSYSATEALVTLTGSSLPMKGYIMSGDRLTLITATNTIRRAVVTDILSDTEIVIEAATVDEVATNVTAEDLILTLENPNTKDFAKRRWDLREFYLYG